MIIKGLFFGVILFVFPFLIGMFCNRIMERNNKRLLLNWVNGFIVMLGVFQIFVLPSIAIKCSLSMLSHVYFVFLFGVSCVSVYMNRDDIKSLLLKIPKMMKNTPWQSYVAFALVLMQIATYFFGVHRDDDDSFFVAMSAAAVGTDTVFEYDPYTGELYDTLPMRYVLSPFPVFTAVLSRLSGVHVATVAHTMMPVFLLGLTYAIYVLLGKELFKGKKVETAWFVIWISLMSLFMSETVYMQGTFSLIRIWQGKAILTATLLPYVLYLGYRKYRDRSTKREWMILLFTMLACTLVSSMGIILGAIMTGIMGIIVYCKQRNKKDLFTYMYCCIPNVLLAILYVIFR